MKPLRTFPLFRLLLVSFALPALPALPVPLVAQTAPARPAARTPATGSAHSTPAHSSATGGACARLPPISPKIPALPTSAPCAKALYTITSIPGAKLENVSPMEWPSLHETLGMDPVSFSLDYVEVKVGTGELAAPKKWYTIHYSGYLADGTKFDSSYDHPDHAPITIQIGVHGVIPGWDTGLAGMRVGGKRRLFIPYELGYGAANYPPPPRPTVIPGKSELIFDVEFVAQSDHEPPPPPAPAAAPPTSSVPPGAPGAAAAQTVAPAAAAPAAAPATAPAATTPPASGTLPPASPASSAPPAPAKPQ